MLPHLPLLCLTLFQHPVQEQLHHASPDLARCGALSHVILHTAMGLLVSYSSVFWVHFVQELTWNGNATLTR